MQKILNSTLFIKNKEAIKKLENVKKDHQKRIDQLKRTQVGFNLLYKF